MNVTDVQTFVANGGDAHFVFVEVLTDEGLAGVGECILEGKELAVLGKGAGWIGWSAPDAPTALRRARRGPR